MFLLVHTIKQVGPGIENKTNLFMIPNFRPKLAKTLNKAPNQQIKYQKTFCHLGQMLRLELEPITSSYFLLPFSKHLFSHVYGTKRGVLKTIRLKKL